MKYGGLTVVGGVGAVVAAPVLLTTVGFNGAGIAAGSLAAGVQAVVGNVAGKKRHPFMYKVLKNEVLTEQRK